MIIGELELIQRFITMDNQILMVCVGDEIAIVRMDENPILDNVQVQDHIIQSRNQGGRLVLRVSDSLLEIIGPRYMTGVGLNYQEQIIEVTPTCPFELAIVSGDTTDRNTWKMQCMWEGCVIDGEEFKPSLSLNNDELVMHTLPIDFVNMQRYGKGEKK